MDFNKLGKLGAFLGGVAALGGMVIVILDYLDTGYKGNKPTSEIPFEINVSTDNSVTQKTIEKAESLLGLWVAHPMEIYTEVSSSWSDRKQNHPKSYFNPTILTATVRFERAERKDELFAYFIFDNKTFDHQFKAIVKVTDKDIWLLKVTHQKQYGAEPNLKVNTGEIFITKSGMLGVDLKIIEYADISFFAKLDK